MSQGLITLQMITTPYATDIRIRILCPPFKQRNRRHMRPRGAYIYFLN